MKNISRIFAVCLVIFAANQGQADVINYGDFDGDSVTYIDVTESSLEDLPLYGTPEVIGNQLDMPGTGFVTESNNGEINFLDGRLSFTIEADPATFINSVSIEEFGAYFTFGEDSIASVSAIAFVETLEGEIFSGSFDFITQGLGNGLPDSGDWIGGLTITFPQTTQITVTLDNQLFTFADDPGVAFIDKKGVDINVGVIPEPTSAAVLGLALLGLVARRRR